jgi:hypothetical protein
MKKIYATSIASFSLVTRLFCGLMLVGLIAVPTLVAAQARPIISLSAQEYNFGTVAQGAKVVHEFEIKNTGAADLVIQRLSPSCGCTATQLTNSVVRPGASEKVRVTFDTSGFLGDKTKTVLIASNDSESPEKVFTLKGRVITGFSVEPSRVDFGAISPSSSLSSRQREVTFSVAEGTELKITKISSLSNHLIASPVVTQEHKAIVKVEILPTAPKGEFRDRLIFELDGGKRAAVNVPVNASIQGDLQLNPGTLSFGVVEGAQPLERRVQFENKGVKPVDIKDITASDSAVSASMIEVQPGRQGVLVVKVDPRRVTGDLKATVDVQTDHPDERVLTLNVFGVQPPR